jgi:hypothetical protein
MAVRTVGGYVLKTVMLVLAVLLLALCSSFLTILDIEALYFLLPNVSKSETYFVIIFRRNYLDSA